VYFRTQAALSALQKDIPLLGDILARDESYLLATTFVVSLIVKKSEETAGSVVSFH
jgi:hypothetical protein